MLGVEIVKSEAGHVAGNLPRSGSPLKIWIWPIRSGKFYGAKWKRAQFETDLPRRRSLAGFAGNGKARWFVEVEPERRGGFFFEAEFVERFARARRAGLDIDLQNFCPFGPLATAHPQRNPASISEDLDSSP